MVNVAAPPPAQQAKYNEEREASWKRDAEVWMAQAKSKVDEMNKGAQLIAKLAGDNYGSNA